jgi:hypothetical protein
MTCRECLEKIADLSADDVAASSAQTMLDHLESCPQCQREWSIFEHTLFVVSTTSQPLPAPQASDAMWQGCCDHIFNKVETQRGKGPSLYRWAARQPRWGWVSLGGALAILGATWVLAPHEDTLDVLANGVPSQVVAVNSQAGLGSPGPLITFERPPAGASGLVNHHSAMATDPLADNVGSTMVSYSATAPTTATATTSTTAPTPTITSDPASVPATNGQP